MKTIAVHNGRFHADDAFAVAIFKLIDPDIKIIRTRNHKELEEADVRIDVGRKYNPDTGDFDHHQEEFKEKRENGIPYTSAGLVWRDLGKKLVSSEEGFNYIDETLIQPVDAQDDGIEIFSVEKIPPYTIDKTISSFLPHWGDENQDYDGGFENAVSFAVDLLKRELKYANSIEEAEKRVRDAISASNGKYIVLEPPTPPWKKIVVKETKVQFVIYKYAEESWSAMAVPINTWGFESRKQFPKEWADLRWKELAEKTGVKDAIFCHKGLFAVFATSKEGAIMLAEEALKKD